MVVTIGFKRAHRHRCKTRNLAKQRKALKQNANRFSRNNAKLQIKNGLHKTFETKKVGGHDVI